MKRNIALLLVVLMAFMMTGIMSFAEENVNEFTLYAGQDINVGTVQVSNDGEYIYVKYILNGSALGDGWLIYETHVHVGTDLKDFPLNNKGNPQVGLFDYGMAHDGVEEYEEVIPMGDFEPGDNLLIAAHAVIEIEEVTHKEDTSFSIVSTPGDTKFEKDGIWNDAVLSYIHPNWITTYGSSTPFGANWVWNSFYVSNPVIGETVEFKHDFTVDGTPESAVLTITADNSYNAYINGVHVGSDATWTNAEEYYPVVDEGTNTLTVTAVNAPQVNGNEFSNPAGIAFKLCVKASKIVVDVECANESAWANGTRFVAQGNWATYFVYELTHGKKLLETIDVSAKGDEAVTKTELDDDKEYLVVASGTYRFATWAPPEYAGFADAKFNCRKDPHIPDLTGKTEGEDYKENSDDTVWINGDSFGYTEGLQLRINGDWAKWVGEYNDNHTYEKTITDYEGTLVFKIFDNAYGDNIGFLTVNIYEIW